MRKNECVVTKQKVVNGVFKFKNAVSALCGAAYLAVQGFTMTVFANGEVEGGGRRCGCRNTAP